MTANANAEEVTRTETPKPNREYTTTRNKTSQRNCRNSGSNNRQVRDFLGVTKDIEAILTLVTDQADKGVTFESFQETLKNYVLKSL